MKFYTKEWYDLMQHLHYTCGVKKIPDKEYSDKEIKKLYYLALKKEVGTIKDFKEGYRIGMRYVPLRYSAWVLQAVDKRLLALDLMPERVYRQLKKEEQKNRRVFQKIGKKAEEILSKQEVSEELRASFQFHDSHLLTLKKVRSNVELCMHNVNGWTEGTPYVKVVFKKVVLYDREKGFVLRKKQGQDGAWESNCQFLYKEIYRTEYGYEVHMLLWAGRKPWYLTIGCEEILIEDNIQL